MKKYYVWDYVEDGDGIRARLLRQKACVEKMSDEEYGNWVTREDAHRFSELRGCELEFLLVLRERASRARLGFDERFSKIIEHLIKLQRDFLPGGEWWHHKEHCGKSRSFIMNMKELGRKEKARKICELDETLKLTNLQLGIFGHIEHLSWLKSKATIHCLTVAKILEIAHMAGITDGEAFEAMKKKEEECRKKELDLIDVIKTYNNRLAKAKEVGDAGWREI